MFRVVKENLFQDCSGEKYVCMSCSFHSQTVIETQFERRMEWDQPLIPLVRFCQSRYDDHVNLCRGHNALSVGFRSIILPVVLYGCEAWSLTLREERKLRVFENMVLRRIFGPRRDEITREWRRLHNEELSDLYSSPNIVRVIKSRRMRWAGHVARMGEERGVYRVLVGKPEGKRPLGRPRRRWVDNIRMDLQEVGCGNVDWIGLAQDRDRWRTLVSAVMNLRVP